MPEKKSHNSTKVPVSNTKNQSYSTHDLADAIVIAWKYSDALAPLRDFYKQRATAMCAAFGAKLAARHIEPGLKSSELLDTPGLTRDEENLIGEIGHFIHSVNSVSSPFDGYLEAPKIVFELYRKHSKHIKELVSSLRSANLNLLTDALCKVYHIDPNHTVTDDDLLEHGFDPDQPWPDPDDYL